MVMWPCLPFLALGLTLWAGLAHADLRLYGAAAGGEVEGLQGSDFKAFSALWQGGLSLEAESPFAMAFLQPWLSWYDRGPAYEAVAGAGIGLPLRWIDGHAWVAAEASLHSVNVPTYPGLAGPEPVTDWGGPRVPRRELRRAFGPSFRLDAWRGYGALTFLSDLYPMWRAEIGYRLFPW